MIGIVVSRADEASAHIGAQLLDLAEWDRVEEGVYRRPGFELREFDDLHLDLDRVGEAFEDPAFVVFASRHSGETGPLLSAHYTGNFGSAEYGGAPRELSEPAPKALKQVIQALDREAPAAYDVAMECTHHGPTDHAAPGLFVELGSAEPQWEDQDAARAVASAILSLEGVAARDGQTIVAFGGNHYAPRPTRLLLETSYSVGHVAADWSLEELGDPDQNRALLEELFESSGAQCAIFDGEQPALREVVDELGYRIVSETWVRETSDVDPTLVEAVETSLGRVDSGVRFGSVRPHDGFFEVVDLPAELLAECHGIDAEATVEAVSECVVAYHTQESGTLVGEQVAVADGTAYTEIVSALQEVLAGAYESVRREDDTVVAEREAFDPGAAAELGVPEGPDFGRLANGNPVTVDGERVDPEAVHVTEIRRFEV